MMCLRFCSEVVLFCRRQLGVIVEAAKNLFWVEDGKQDTKDFREKPMIEGRVGRLRLPKKRKQIEMWWMSQGNAIIEAMRIETFQQWMPIS